MRNFLLLLTLLSFGAVTTAQRIPADSVSQPVRVMMDQLITALLEENQDSGFLHCVQLLDTAMYRLYPQKMKNSYINAHEGIHLYAFPAKICYADIKNRNWKGTWMDVYLGYREGLLGDPRIVRIFIPADGSMPRVLNFSDL